MRFSSALRDATVSNAGLGMVMNKGVIRCYGGEIPASPDQATTDTILAEISQDGVPYLPGNNKDIAGLRLKLRRTGKLVPDGEWRLIGKAFGNITWARWYSSMVDNFGTNTDYPRIDFESATELFMISSYVTPTTNSNVGDFILELPMG
jgi:hypothetical protein